MKNVRNSQSIFILNSLKHKFFHVSIVNMFLVLYIWSLRKSELCLFSVKVSVKIYRYVPYRYRAILDSVNFWDVKIPRAKIEAHFLKKLASVTKKFSRRCLPRKSKDNRKPFKIHISTQIVLCTNLPIPVSGLYRLPRCIVTYKTVPKLTQK